MKKIKNKIIIEQKLAEYKLHEILLGDTIQFLSLYQFEEGETLSEEGKSLDQVYFFLEGSCKISRLLYTGIEAIIAIHNQFQVYGEVELFENECANTTITLLDTSLCFVVSYEHKEKLINDCKFLQFCIKCLSEKMNRYDKNFLINLHYPLEIKLSRYIVNTAKQDIFKSNFTHLADYLGCSHRHLLRVIRKMCDERILKKMKGGVYLIINFDKLESMNQDNY